MKKRKPIIKSPGGKFSGFAVSSSSSALLAFCVDKMSSVELSAACDKARQTDNHQRRRWQPNLDIWENLVGSWSGLSSPAMLATVLLNQFQSYLKNKMIFQPLSLQLLRATLVVVWRNRLMLMKQGLSHGGKIGAVQQGCPLSLQPLG